MPDIYEKDGRTRFAQFARGSLCSATVIERGRATSDAATGFRAEALAADEGSIDSRQVDDLASQLLTIRDKSLLERFTIAGGSSNHLLTSERAQRHWSTTHYRSFVTLARKDLGVRFLVESGGRTPDDIDIARVLRITEALESCKGCAPHRGTFLLPADVVARIASGLAHTAAARTAAALRLQQRAPSADPLDGDGAAIEMIELTAGAAPPNVFRPTYRLPPVRMPMHVELVERSTAASAPDAVEVLAGEVAMTNGFLSLTLLCSHASVATLQRARVELQELGRRLEVTALQERWFPFAAGAWGTAALLTPPDESAA